MAMDDPCVSVDALTAFGAAVFSRLGLRAEDAAVAAECLVGAHLRGFDTHGVSCLPAYAGNLREGRINPTPDVRIERTASGVCMVDGDNGMGHPVAVRAMDAAITAARDVGIGAAAIRHGNHIGAASLYPLRAVAEGCIGLTVANSSPTVAPWGSRLPLLGTNPFAAAAPAGRHPPFVMDFATSMAARRKLRLAMAGGDRIPEGWALDEQGAPTTDPAAALAGTGLPFGGHKGAAIGLLIDILAGVLSGAAYGGDVLSFLANQERSADTGTFHLVLRVDAFMPLDAFAERMDTLIDRIEALPPAAGFEEVRVPGRRGAELQAERRTTGIPLPHQLRDDLGRLAKDIGIDRPEWAITG